jgi:hypothetical protein
MATNAEVIAVMQSLMAEVAGLREAQAASPVTRKTEAKAAAPVRAVIDIRVATKTEQGKGYGRFAVTKSFSNGFEKNVLFFPNEAALQAFVESALTLLS